MAGKLTWNGIPLCVPDPDGELERWLAQFHRIDELVAWCGEAEAVSSNNAPRSQAGTGITPPNYPHLGPLQLNQLVWPTGATRFGYFVGILPKGLADVGSLGSTGSLVLSDGTTTQTVSMQVLAYRPLAFGDGTASLLILVDRRYSWQFVNAGNIITASGYPMLDTDGTYDGTPNNDYGQLQISYAEVFSAIETAIGATITKSDVSGFLVPDVLELSNRKYFNAAAMLDAVAQSCGLRVWLDFDGTPHAENSSVSYTGNFDDVTNAIAGGLAPTNTPTPARFYINFRSASQYRAYQDNDTYTIQVFGGSGGIGEAVVDSCAYAHFLTVPDNYDNLPDNSANLSNLAANIVNGISGWFGKAYDVTFDGIKDWTVTGYDNVLTIDYAQDIHVDRQALADAEEFNVNTYRFTTRAQSMPANFGSFINLSQDPSIRFLRGLQWGKLVADAVQPVDGTTPQPASVQIWQLDSSFAEHNTGITIQAYDVSLSPSPLKAGDRVTLWFHEVNRLWVMEPFGNEPAIVRVTGSSSVEHMAQKNASCLWSGNLIDYQSDQPPCSGEQYQPHNSIWVAILNNDGEQINYLPTSERYLGSCVGTYAIGGDSRPLYVVKAGHYLVRFQLISPLLGNVPSGSNNAVVLWWNGTDYAPSSQVITVVDPYAPNGGMFTGFQQTAFQIGYRGVAEWKPDRQVYEIVYMQGPAKWIRFQIAAERTLLLSSASVTANVLSFWGGKNPDPANVGLPVYQQAGKSSGIFAAPEGAVGFAVYDDYNNRYAIVFVQTWPQFITGKLATALSGGLATGTVTAQWSPIGFVPITAETVSLIDKTSPNIFEGAVNDQYRATWSAADNAYVIEWVEC